jgi:hypothetical protein
VQPSADQLKVTEGFTLIPGAVGWVKLARKLTVTCSFAKGKILFLFTSSGEHKRRPSIKSTVLTSVGQIHVEPGTIPDLRHHILALQNGEMERGQEKFVRYVCHSRFVHQQDRPALVVKHPLALEDDSLNVRNFSVSPMMMMMMIFGSEPRMPETRDLRSNVSVHIQLSYFKRVDMIMINLGCPNGTVLAGDLCDIGVGIYVSLDNQLPSLFVDGAKITGLVFVGKEETGGGSAH